MGALPCGILSREREKMDSEKKLFYERKGYFITDLRGYRLFHCTVAPIGHRGD